MKIGVITFVLLIVMIPNIDTIAGLTFDRFLTSFEERGLVSALLSSRDEFFRLNLNAYIDSANDLLSVLVASGYSGLISYFENNFPNNYKYSVEMDFVDIITWYGFFGIACVFAMYYSCIKEIKITRDIAVLFSLLLIISFFVGHVLASGMLGPILGIAFLYFSQKKDEIKQ